MTIRQALLVGALQVALLLRGPTLERAAVRRARRLLGGRVSVQAAVLRALMEVVRRSIQLLRDYPAARATELMALLVVGLRAARPHSRE